MTNISHIWAAARVSVSRLDPVLRLFLLAILAAGTICPLLAHGPTLPPPMGPPESWCWGGWWCYLYIWTCSCAGG